MPKKTAPALLLALSTSFSVNALSDDNAEIKPYQAVADGVGRVAFDFNQNGKADIIFNTDNNVAYMVESLGLDLNQSISCAINVGDRNPDDVIVVAKSASCYDEGGNRVVKNALNSFLVSAYDFNSNGKADIVFNSIKDDISLVSSLNIPLTDSTTCWFYYENRFAEDVIGDIYIPEKASCDSSFGKRISYSSSADIPNIVTFDFNDNGKADIGFNIIDKEIEFNDRDYNPMTITIEPRKPSIN